MSDTTWIINYGGIVLKGRFEGEEFEKASVKFSLVRADTGKVIEEIPMIPVKELLSCVYVIGLSLQKYEAQLVKDLQRMKGEQ